MTCALALSFWGSTMRQVVRTNPTHPARDADDAFYGWRYMRPDTQGLAALEARLQALEAQLCQQRGAEDEPG